MTQMTFTRTQTETALCIWEAFNDLTIGPRTMRFQPLRDFREKVGSVHLRQLAMDLAVPFDAAWNSIPDEVTEDFIPFDWEFVPTLARMLTVEHDTLVLPPVEEIEARLRAMSPDAQAA